MIDALRFNSKMSTVYNNFYVIYEMIQRIHADVPRLSFNRATLNYFYQN